MGIRLEEEKDYFAVENLTREAFWNVYRPGCNEHLVTHNLRKAECFVKELCFVYEKDGEAVGSIVYAKGKLKKDDGKTDEILLFGPVAVLPKYQKQGIGKALIEYSLLRAKEMGFPCVVITGNFNYYRKFGFESASKHGVFYNGIDKSEESPFFMLKVLNAEKMQNVKGEYFEPKEYFPADEELNEFEKQFPPKVKEKREGQLV